MVRNSNTMNQYVLIALMLNSFLLYSLYSNRDKPRIKNIYRTQRTQHIQMPRRPVTISTQRTQSYETIGMLYNDANVILPLLGRQTHQRSHMWNYYTFTNDTIPIKIQISKDGYNCESSIGCKEFYDGDSIFVPELNSTFSVKIYDKAPIYRNDF